MLKKTVQYKDLDGNNVVDDFYFNLSKAELAELEMSEEGGLMEYIKAIVEAEEGGKIMAIFKKIILMSIGQRAPDGKRFIKSDQIRTEFEQTDAYSVVFMELCTDAAAGAEFVRGIMPADLAAQIDAGQTPANALGVPQPPQPSEPAWITEGRMPTEAELVGANPDQLREAFRRKSAESSASPSTTAPPTP